DRRLSPLDPLDLELHLVRARDVELPRERDRDGTVSDIADLHVETHGVTRSTSTATSSRVSLLSASAVAATNRSAISSAGRPSVWARSRLRSSSVRAPPGERS